MDLIIESCESDCPFFNNMGRLKCLHPIEANGREIKIADLDMPSWCPLSTHPVTIKL